MTNPNRTVEQTAAEQDALMLKIHDQTLAREQFDTWEQGTTRNPVSGRVRNTADGDGSDEGLNVVFTTEQVFHKFNTVLADGVPQYVDMDFTTITIPGRNDLSVHRPVSEHDKWRFHQEYSAYKLGIDNTSGTPLAKWADISAADIRDLNRQGITTVEQVSNLSDAAGGNLRGFYSLRTRALAYISGLKTPEQEVVDQKLDRQQSTIDALTRQLETITALLEKSAIKKPSDK